MGNRNQRFGSSSTAEQVAKDADLSGKIVIVTGSNTGIGQETARVLVLHGATVIMACRDTTKGQKAIEEILKTVPTTKEEKKKETATEEKKETETEEKKEIPNDNIIKNGESEIENDVNKRIQLMKLDLGSLQSVRDFAVEFTQHYDQLHYLVNNAGIMANVQYTMSTDGYEVQFATNHLGHYYLIRLLTPTMLKTNGKSRVVQVSSAAHNKAPNPFQEYLVELEKTKSGPVKENYEGWRNYGISKGCNALCARHVNTLYSQQENGIYGVSLHPGVIVTDLWKNVPGGIQWLVKNVGKPFIKNVMQGAATSVRCVCISDEELKGGGQYYVDCNAHNDKLRADMRLADTTDEQSMSMDALLWKLSEDLIVVKGFSMTLEEEAKPKDTTTTTEDEKVKEEKPSEQILVSETSEPKEIQSEPKEIQSEQPVQSEKMDNGTDDIVVEAEIKSTDASN